MNLVVRRRLAAGALLSSSALVAGLLLAPESSAATGGLTITPNGAVNTNKAAVLTYNTKDADLEFGGEATFQRIGGGQPFVAPITGTSPAPTGADRSQTGTEDFTDEGAGVGIDGPADSGTYNVSVTGDGDPITGDTTLAGGGTDTCASCFTVLPGGTLSVSGATPTSIRPGVSTNIKIAGTGFERGTTVQFLFADGNPDPLITANTAPKDTSNPPKDIVEAITTPTMIWRTAKVDVNDAPGARGIRVTHLDGTTATCSACFFVAGPALSSISPTSGLNTPGTAPVTVTFNGPNVVNGTPRLEFTGTPGSSTRDALSLDPIPGTATQSNGQSISAQFDLQNAAPGQYQGVVRQSSTGITNACESPCSAFTVIQSNRAPAVTGLDRDPNTAGNQKDQQVGTTQVFTVNGNNFSKGVAIKVFNTGTTTATTGVTVTNVEFVGPTSVKATFVADKAATPGDYDITATLTDGSTSAACSKCYTLTAAGSTPSPSTAPPSSSPCPSSSSSSTPSATPTSTISASPSTTPSATGSPSASTTSSPTATASATSTATVSPSASGCPSNRQQATLTVEDDTIAAGSTARLFATGAPNQQYSLQCYTRPSTTYTEARAGTFSADGSPATFTLSLGRNTRCYLRYATNPTQGASNSVVINVNTVLSLSAIRKGVRTYEFRGRNLPRVAGQLITLYRVDAAGNEIRTSNLKTDNSGIYTVTRKFTGNGTFKFRVRTSKTNDNAAGVSNTITVNVK